jgi:hypothetical protein
LITGNTLDHNGVTCKAGMSVQEGSSATIQNTTINASGSQTYSKDFTCDADAGVQDNTASIRGTSKSDNASVTVNCHSLTVTKDASTSLKRTYHWTIDKQADQVDVTLGIGETATVNYDVVLGATFTDGDWAVTGTLLIQNPAPIQATINSISDIVSWNIRHGRLWGCVPPCLDCRRVDELLLQCIVT